MKNTLIFCFCLLTFSCQKSVHSRHNTVYVSLLPQQYIVKKISGNLLDVQCLVPNGVAPETYDMSPKQMFELSKSKLLFTSGLLHFEENIYKSAVENSNSLKVISLAQGIKTLTGHTFAHGDHIHGGDSDPHTWCSPKQMRISAATVFHTLMETYPQFADSFAFNYHALNLDIDRLDSLANCLLSNNTRNTFMIFHPTLTYLANDYHLVQMPIEVDGKEPSIKYIQDIITIAQKQGMKTLFVQKEFSVSFIENIAHEFNGKLVVINPLSEDWSKEMERTIRLLNVALNE